MSETKPEACGRCVACEKNAAMMNGVTLICRQQREWYEQKNAEVVAAINANAARARGGRPPGGCGSGVE